MRARDAVITAPHRVPALRRGAFAGLTLMAWSAFAWLLTPLLTLLLWAVGLRTAYDEGVRRLGDVDGVLLLAIGASATVLCLTLLAWAAVQRRRFSGRDRRVRPVDVTPADVALAVGATAQATAVLRTASVVVVHLDGDGAPVLALRGGTSVGIPTQRPATEVEVPAPRSAPAESELLPAGG